MRVFEVFPEYDCDPIWEIHSEGPSTCTSPEALPISKELAKELQDWGDEYRDFFINTETVFEEKPVSKDKQYDYLERGRRLAQRLQIELGTEAKVTFKEWP